MIAALAWFSSAGLNPAPRAWLAFLLAGLPAMMLAQARLLRDAGPLPRMPAYVSSIISLWLLALVTVGVARIGGLRAVDLGIAGMPLQSALLWTGFMTLAGLAVVLLFHLAGFRESDVTRQLIPVTSTEKATFLGVSATAGICEELVFRGFMITALYAATRSVALAVILSSFAFGIVHAYQQPAGALRAGVLGAILAAPFIVTGSLLPSVLAHTLLDVIAGFWLARFLDPDHS